MNAVWHCYKCNKPHPVGSNCGWRVWTLPGVATEYSRTMSGEHAAIAHYKAKELSGTVILAVQRPGSLGWSKYEVNGLRAVDLDQNPRGCCD